MITQLFHVLLNLTNSKLFLVIQLLWEDFWHKKPKKNEIHIHDFEYNVNVYFLSFSKQINKPKLATMRPDCVSAYIDHVTHMDSQMDKQTDGTTRLVMEALKSCLSRSGFSVGSRRGRKRPKTAVFAQA